MTSRPALRLWVAGAVMAVAFPAALALSARSGEVFEAAFLAGFIPYGLIGLLIVRHRPGNAIGGMFLLLGVVTPLASGAAGYARLRLPGAAWAGWASDVTFPVVFGVVLVFLPLLFPTGRFLSRGWRRFGMFALAELAAMTLVFALAPGRLDCCLGLRSPVRADALEFLGGIAEAGFSAIAATSVVALASLVARYRRATGDERLQLKWFTLAVAYIVLTAVGGALNAMGVIPDSDVIPLIVYPSGIAAIGIAAGIAVLRYRLYDIDLVINKTLVYGSLAAFISAVYVGVVVGIGHLLGTRGEPNLGLQIAATALVAVAFQPVRARVQRLANRLVYGERATPYEVMADFGRRIASSVRADDVLPEIAEVAARSVGARMAAVRLHLPDGVVRAVTWPDEAEPGTFDLALDVVHQGERVGEIAVAKAPADPVRAQDEDLLRDLAIQTGLAMHNVRLTEELQARVDEVERGAAELEASRARLVGAEDRERRRIEGAIGAGAVRALEEMLVGLEAAEATVAADPEGASAELERLGGVAAATLEDLRDLARGIYPPLLADQGLVAALEAQARKAVVQVELQTDGVGRYGQEVEAGVYFCCLELLRTPGVAVRISLEDRGGRLHLLLELRGRVDPEVFVRIADRIKALGGEVVAEEDGDRTTIAAVVEAPSLAPAG